jgi:hypothetical protein
MKPHRLCASRSQVSTCARSASATNCPIVIFFVKAAIRARCQSGFSSSGNSKGSRYRFRISFFAFMGVIMPPS